MKMKVIGVQSVDYVSRKTGNPVKGTTIYACYKDDGVVGERCDNLYVSDALECKAIESIKPGSMIEVTYNRFGRVSDVALLPN